MKSLKSLVTSSLKQNYLIPENSTVIVALSGGPDSVFLLHMLAQLQDTLGFKLIAAHLDHEWRAESGKEADFCTALAASYNILLIRKKMTELSLHQKPNGSKEELGRHARRAFLQQVAHEHNAQRIALAHHADDQQETFFIRLARGAGLTGLTGMKPMQDNYIRPLLAIYKKDILAYLHEHQIPYVIDASNESDDYLRNRIRKALPVLQAADARFDANFAQTISRLQETEEYLNAQMLALYADICPNNELAITVFLQQHLVMRTRILIHWLCQHHVRFTPSAALFEEIERFLKQPGNGNHTFYNLWKIEKKNDKAKLVALNS